jgi:hypothetical protein
LGVVVGRDFSPLLTSSNERFVSSFRTKISVSQTEAQSASDLITMLKVKTIEVEVSLGGPLGSSPNSGDAVMTRVVAHSVPFGFDEHDRDPLISRGS